MVDPNAWITEKQVLQKQVKHRSNRQIRFHQFPMQKPCSSSPLLKIKPSLFIASIHPASSHCPTRVQSYPPCHSTLCKREFSCTSQTMSTSLNLSTFGYTIPSICNTLPTWAQLCLASAYFSSRSRLRYLSGKLLCKEPVKSRIIVTITLPHHAQLTPGNWRCHATTQGRIKVAGRVKFAKQLSWDGERTLDEPAVLALIA